jgi:hypothetical protein
MAEGSRPVKWLRYVLEELGRPIRSPVPLLCDNQGAIATVGAEHHSSRTRYIALAHNTIFHLADVGLLKPAHVPSKDMPADMLTKPLSRIKFQACRSKLGLLALGETLASYSTTFI